MRATINTEKVVMSVPAEYVGQQTCSNTTFEHVPSELIDKEALILAHRHGIVNGWYSTSNGFNFEVPNDKIEWED